MNGKIRIRHIYKATELKRFGKLEGKYHHMGELYSLSYLINGYL